MNSPEHLVKVHFHRYSLALFDGVHGHALLSVGSNEPQSIPKYRFAISLIQSKPQKKPRVTIVFPIDDFHMAVNKCSAVYQGGMFYD